AQALCAVRRQRIWRRIRTAGIAVSLAAAALLLVWRGPRPRVEQARVLQPQKAETLIKSFRQTPEAGRGDSPVRIETISDEQLVATFPPGSCFLAEINGEKVLVFTDPKLQAEVLR